MTIVNLPEWQALEAHAATVGSQHLRDLFAADPDRYEHLSRCELNLLFDYSRQRVTPETVKLLLKLARARGVPAGIDAMFAGEKINLTEQRAVLHTALRNRSGRAILVDGQDVMPDVRASLEKMRDFVEGVHGGRIHGATGKSFTDIVNIGIGGSDLGIVMATEALAKVRNRNLRLHCVSNIDGVQLGDVLEKVDAARTLFVVCSKTFSTLETLTNAKLARQWIVDRLGAGAPARHFAAVSTNAKAMDAFLIPPQNRFTMWDWVGGRYSMWSAVGLSIALILGMDQFDLILEGAHEMDEHFRTAPLERNLPVLMGMLAVWNRNFLKMDTLAVLPYDQRLHRFSAYLQQLEMESNGKGVTTDGQPVSYDTGAVIWGEPGSNAQHSFSCCTRARRASRRTSWHPSMARAPIRNSRTWRWPTALRRLRPLHSAIPNNKCAASWPQSRCRPVRSSAWCRTRCIRAIARVPSCCSSVWGPRRWVGWSRSMSTRCSRRAWFGASTPSINGAWSWARSSQSRSRPQSRILQRHKSTHR
jgi:glucose-6-phosphate isomerase